MILETRGWEGIKLEVRDSVNVLSSLVNMIQLESTYLSSYASAMTAPESVQTVTLSCRSLKSCA